MCQEFYPEALNLQDSQDWEESNGRQISSENKWTGYDPKIQFGDKVSGVTAWINIAPASVHREHRNQAKNQTLRNVYLNSSLQKAVLLLILLLL